MQKLILRLLAVILSLYVVGSIYPLFATEWGHSHGPAPSGPPPPPPSPPPTPTAPPMLDTKTPPLAPPPPQAPGEGGCGPEGSRALSQAAWEQESWRTQVDFLTNENTKHLRNMAEGAILDIRWDVKQAQDRWHKADIEVNTYQTKKNQGTLANPQLLQMALEERERCLQELQRQKDREKIRIEKVETWRTQKLNEIRSQHNRAKNGDYNGYRGLNNFDWSYPPDQFK
jgi:hypothetical protein